MVLREDKIGQQLLVPLDLRDLIPKDHPCYFIQNVVDQMDFSKVEKIDSELKKTTNDVISINDPESRWMLNKKSKWEFDYNLQIGIDEYKGIIVSSSLTQNPTDVFELIPQIEQIKETFVL